MKAVLLTLLIASLAACTRNVSNNSTKVIAEPKLSGVTDTILKNCFCSGKLSLRRYPMGVLYQDGQGKLHYFAACTLPDSLYQPHLAIRFDTLHIVSDADVFTACLAFGPTPSEGYIVINGRRAN